jgi:cbb3-type cytochrome oxidase subunit 3
VPSAEAEVYFIAAMMVLILVISFVAVYFFVRQYRKEMRGRAEAAKRKAARKDAPADETGPHGE